MNRMKIPWRRLGAGFAGALGGATLGAVMGFAGAFIGIAAYHDGYQALRGIQCRGEEGMLTVAGVPFGAIHGGVVGFIIGLGVRNALGWLLGAQVGLCLWAPLLLCSHRSGVIPFLAIAMPLWCGGIGAALQQCFTNERGRPRQEPPEEGSRTEGLPANRTQVQIAGSKCKECERTIILSNEGKFCARCGTAVHCHCEPRATCDVCDEPYHAYEHA